jgi:hypothetical protein
MREKARLEHEKQALARLLEKEKEKERHMHDVTFNGVCLCIFSVYSHVCCVNAIFSLFCF